MPLTIRWLEGARKMGFKTRLIIMIAGILLATVVSIWIIVAVSVPRSSSVAAIPVVFPVAIALLIAGGLIAAAIAAMTSREIGRRTGAMQEGWEKSFKILHSIPAGIIIVDPQTGKIIEASKAALRAIGAPKRRVIGAEADAFLWSSEEGATSFNEIGDEENGSEGVLLTVKNERIPILRYATRINIKGRPHILEMFLDITDRKDLERRLKDALTHQKNQANYDRLTGVFNRRAITKHAEAELNRAERGGELSVLLMDLDNFKAINDTYGHLAGDEVLKHAASLVRQSLRPYDWVGRWGGEEFLVLLPNAAIEEAAEIAERLRAAISASIVRVDGGQDINFSTSIGVASTSANARTFIALDTLISQADGALYRAKSEGRNRICMAHCLPG